MKEIFFWAIDSTPILDQGPFFLLSSRHAGCRYCHALRGSWKRVFRLPSSNIPVGFVQSTERMVHLLGDTEAALMNCTKFQ